MQTSIDLPFGDGVYTFKLGLAQINEIQQRCNAGIGAVFARIIKGRYFGRGPDGQVAFGNPSEAEYRIEDLLAIIRQGLIGGGRATVDGQEVGVDAARAGQLIENYILGAGHPLKDAWDLAFAIVNVAAEGYEPPVADAGPKKKGKATAE